jgi:hypothetical protein
MEEYFFWYPSQFTTKSPYFIDKNLAIILAVLNIFKVIWHENYVSCIG